MRVVILGATGMLGHKMWQFLRDRYPETYATIRSRDAIPQGCDLFDDRRLIDDVDATDLARLTAVLERLRPQVLINCVAVTTRRKASEGAIPSITLNALLPHQLARWGAAHKARVIHFSTDCVFSGKTGGYTEASLTDAEDLYGRTKALGEIAGAGQLTLRTSFIGRELANRTELLEWFLAQRGKRIRGFRQAYYTGVSNVYMARLVGDIIERHPGLSGLYNLASEVITKFELLKLARDAFKIDVAIDPDDNFVCRRDLDGRRLQRTLGIPAPSWMEMMTDLAADTTPYDRWRQ